MKALIAAALLLSASPAFATGGLLCAPAGGDGPRLSLVVGHGVPGGIAGANLDVGDGIWLSTMADGARLALAQAWIDAERVLVDLADPEMIAHVARLSVRFVGRTGRAEGTLTLRGRTWRVSCAEA